MSRSRSAFDLGGFLILVHRIEFGEECFLLVLVLHTVADINGLPVTGLVGDFEAEFFVVLAGLDPLASALDGHLDQLALPALRSAGRSSTAWRCLHLFWYSSAGQVHSIAAPSSTVTR